MANNIDKNILFSNPSTIGMQDFNRVVEFGSTVMGSLDLCLVGSTVRFGSQAQVMPHCAQYAICGDLHVRPWKFNG